MEHVYEYNSLDEMEADERPSHISEEEWNNRMVHIRARLTPPTGKEARERIEQWRRKEQAGG